MNNTTTNQTSNATGNATATDTITDTLLDLLGTNQEALLIVSAATIAGSYAYYRVPLVRQYADTYLPIMYIRALAAKFLKKHGTEVDALIDTNLTKIQRIAFEKLDAQLQKQVKDEILKDVILSAYDQNDDKLKNQVRDDVRNALAKARGESK
jgi:hypothetical protein|tara:strand:+ start:2129 stop:2587 length:459 start_codon:yes stop_codon:yes gene_type:complete